MLITFLISLLTSLVIIMGGGSANAQMSPPVTQQNPPDDAPAPEPEVIKQTYTITVENNLISVELVNANFGETIQTIAQKAGFSVVGYSDAFSTKVTTRFDNLEIDRGFARLFSLVKESNYLISYDEKGSISKLEIYGNISAGSVQKSPAKTQISPVRPSVRPGSPLSRRSISPRLSIPGTRPLPTEPSQQTEPFQPPQPSQLTEPSQLPQPSPVEQEQDPQDIGHDDIPAQDVKEIPYIPPQKKPVYIPPIRR